MGYARRLGPSAEKRFSLLGIAATVDVSADGIRFLAHDIIPERSWLELEVVLDGWAARVEQARVVRVASRRDGTFDVAAHFEQCSETARGTIMGYVAERLVERRSAA